MTSALGNGKICYVELPAKDVRCSAEFYEKGFDWRIRKRRPRAAFDNGVGGVGGTWCIGRTPAEGELLIYIMVHSVVATLEQLVVQGGELGQAIRQNASQMTARFRDPAGNILGLYKHATDKA